MYDYDRCLRYLLDYASVMYGLADWEECPKTTNIWDWAPLHPIHSGKHMNEFGSLSKPLFTRTRILFNSSINRQELSNSLWLRVHSCPCKRDRVSLANMRYVFKKFIRNKNKGSLLSVHVLM